MHFTEAHERALDVLVRIVERESTFPVADRIAAAKLVLDFVPVIDMGDGQPPFIYLTEDER